MHKLRDFFVCQACLLSIGWKSRMSAVVRIISQEQGCPPRGGIWRKLAANTWAYEQKLHIRQSYMDNVAKETEVQHYRECKNVNAEATWVERNKLTLRGLPISLDYGAEVSRSHSKPETSCNQWNGNAEASQKDEGRNVRMVKLSGSLWCRRQQPKHIRELPVWG